MQQRCNKLDAGKRSFKAEQIDATQRSGGRKARRAAAWGDRR